MTTRCEQNYTATDCDRTRLWRPEAGRMLRRLVFGGALAISVLYPTSGRADSGNAEGCKASAITGTSDIDPATGAFVGGGTLVLDGHVNQIRWVSVILSASVAANGTLTLTGSHQISSSDSGSIDLKTLDVVTAVPTDVPGRYVFNSHLAVQDGHGHLKGGFLDVTGRVDLVVGHVEIDSSNGDLCAGP